MQGPQGATSGKMYFNGSKIRMELAVGGANQIILVDPANNVRDMIMPQQKVYMESSIDDQQGPMKIPRIEPLNPSDPCSGGTVSDCEHLGTETLNGYATEKWAYTSSAGERVTSWIGIQLGMPIKTQNEDGSSLEFRNIAQGAQAANLFEIRRSRRDRHPTHDGHDGKGQPQCRCPRARAIHGPLRHGRDDGRRKEYGGGHGRDGHERDGGAWTHPATRLLSQARFGRKGQDGS